MPKAQKKKQRKSSPAQEPKVKEFLDMIAPTAVRFNTDTAIVGSTYRCYLALRSYPTSTEELALLRHLGDRSGVALRVYCRKVTPAEENAILHNASNRSRMERSNTDNLKQSVTAEANLQDVVTLITTMQRNQEPLIHCAVFIELSARDPEGLRALKDEVMAELTRSKLGADSLLLRQREGFLSSNPAGANTFGGLFERVLPATSVGNLYPFNYSGKTDPQGFYIGRDKYGSNKQRLKDEGADQLVSNCHQLKMKSPKDGKRYLTDVADTEQLLRIIQSIPSRKAEPFRQWLAVVGRERIEETIDPELTIDRALDTYLKKGYSPEWVHQRLLAIRIRNELTDEWQKRGVQKGVEYAILTDEISKAWSGMTTGQYKRFKGLKKENLRDNMSDLELVLNMLAEATTTQFSKERRPSSFQENVDVARAGGAVAGRTRKDIEAQSENPVITSQNAAQLNQVVTQMIEGAVSEGEPPKDE